VSGTASGLAGKKVFITGGSSGIGKQIAADCLRAGAFVSILADEPVKLESARVELAAISPNVSAFCCDLASSSQIELAAQQYSALYGSPDILINNAGYARYFTFEQMDPEEIQRLILVNFAGPCLMTRAFLPGMIKAGSGDICFMASIAGKIPITPCGVYGGAKHGMVAWAETLRAEIARFGIQVHVICPGRVLTDFFSHYSFDVPRKETQLAIPVAKVSQACIDAVLKNRFMTYVPTSYSLLSWAVNGLPLIFKPLLQRRMSARVDSVYAMKLAQQKAVESR